MERKEKLVEQGMQALASCHPDLAAKFFSRAQELDPDDSDVMDALADALVQCGRGDEARAQLERSTLLRPDRNPAKWFYLAQLQHSEAALHSLTSGIEFLLRGGDLDLAVRAQVGKAYASVAELFLTDLCFAPNAESRCEEAVECSLRHHPGSIDGRLALVSLRLSQCRGKEVIPVVETLFSEVMDSRQRLAGRSIMEDLQTPMEEEPDVIEPDVCISLAKLLLETAALKQDLHVLAAELLEDLLLDDDEQPEVHYLLGLALARGTPPDPAAAEHFETARTLLERHPNEEDAELLAAVRGQLADIAAGRQIQCSEGREGVVPDQPMEDEEWSEEEP